ncbi:DUF4145 domain-containing protein [Sphingobacterium wenxiniae]|uniref:DUF4145 domain-containing protein n=1 Tax=Sphingobacterium wenxiniae TaxID=683125 RepID=A0A1I6PIJ2_9SPHI|nr:DUF4145 domain-containing protein [Sphingobacterium wenxiniae]SFS39989.1 protein of unknown function [Sphingobacterium wenxiniae]
MKDYCTICCTPTNHEIVHQKKITNDPSEDFYWHESYEIIKCMGCDNIQFRKVSWDESMYGWDYDNQTEVAYTEKTYFPPSINDHKRLKNFYEIPQRIRIVYNETLECLKNKCYLLAGAGLRAIIEAICLDQKITGKELATKINNLTKSKLITEKDSHRLHSIRFLGNDSVHEMEVPKESKLRIALDIVEHLINNLYLIDIDANEHLDTIISDYDTFKRMVIKKLGVTTNNSQQTIKAILDKDYRRIEPSYLNNFIQELIEEIKKGTIANIALGDTKIHAEGKPPVQYFVKVEVPKEKQLEEK